MYIVKITNDVRKIQISDMFKSSKYVDEKQRMYQKSTNIFINYVRLAKNLIKVLILLFDLIFATTDLLFY